MEWGYAARSLRLFDRGLVVRNHRPSRHHRDERARHQQGERDVNDEEKHDRRHAQEMHQTRGLKIVEQRR